MGLKSYEDMTPEELRVELKKIRDERLGKGRIKRAQAKTRRVGEGVGRKKKEKELKQVEEADWV